MIYTFFNPNGNVVSTAMSYTAYPFQKGATFLTTKVTDFSYQFKEKDELQKEIESLKNEINILRDKIIDYNEIKKENARFAKYYDFKKENDSLKFVPASIIGMNSVNFFNSFIIDKGSSSGISKNDIVITENGVVGCVCAVNAVCSKVKTILAPDINIGVMDIETTETGVIMGKTERAKENLTQMMFIPAQSSMNPEDIVVTTGTTGLYPKNLKLGKIKSIQYDDKESSYYAVIEPFENLKNLKDVFVITDFQGKGSLLS